MARSRVWISMCSILLLTSHLVGCQAPTQEPSAPLSSFSNAPQATPTPTPSNPPEPAVKTLVAFDPDKLPQKFRYTPKLYASFNTLGFRLLRALHAKHPERNIVFSPELIGSSLLQLYFLATPEVKASILELLELDEQTVNTEYPYFAKQRLYSPYNMSLRHALWLNQTPHTSVQEFKDMPTQGLEVLQADFARSETLDAVKAWYTRFSKRTPLPELNAQKLALKAAFFSHTANFQGR